MTFDHHWISIMSQFSLWYLLLQIKFLKCYGTYLILLKSQLQYSTEIEKRKENRLCLALGQIIRFITLMTNVLWGFYVSKRIIGRGLMVSYCKSKRERTKRTSEMKYYETS